jgi:hypothetical protein
MYFSTTHATWIILKAGLVVGILQCIYCISNTVSGINSEQRSSQPLLRAYKLQSAIIANHRLRPIQLRYPGTECTLYWFWFHASAFVTVHDGGWTYCVTVCLHHSYSSCRKFIAAVVWIWSRGGRLKSFGLLGISSQDFQYSFQYRLRRRDNLIYWQVIKKRVAK